jgi:hypothetical protein
LFVAASALSLGVLGWLVAHAATYRIVEHHHHGVDPGVRHAHGYLGPTGLIASCMAAASLLAIFAVCRRAGHAGHGPGGPVDRGTLLALSVLSTAAFVLAELVEHAAAGEHGVPPLLVLVVGVGVQAVIGAGTSLLWRSCVRSVERLATRRRPAPSLAVGEAASPIPVVATPVVTRVWSRACAGRAPPLTAGS